MSTNRNGSRPCFVFLFKAYYAFGGAVVNVQYFQSDPISGHYAIAEQYLSTHEVQPGLFMILVFRSPALVWDVQMTGTGKIGNIEAKKPWPYVNHYHFRS